MSCSEADFAALCGGLSGRFKRNETLSEYKTVIEEFLNITGKNWAQTTYEDVDLYYGSMSEKIQTGQMKGSTLLKKFRILHSFYNYTNPSGDGTVSNLFTGHLSLLKKYDVRMRARSVDLKDIDRLLDVAMHTGIREYAVITLAFRAGLRPAEICQLKYSDLIWTDTGLFVRTAKDRKEFYTFVPEDASEVIRKYMDSESIRGTSFEEEPHLFRNKRNRPLSPRMIELMIRDLTVKGNLPDLSLYDIRNCSANMLFSYGGTPLQVAEHLRIGYDNVLRYKNSAFSAQLMKQAEDLVRIRVLPPE